MNYAARLSAGVREVEPMVPRVIVLAGLIAVSAAGQVFGQDGFTVSLCYKEFPTSGSCSPIEFYNHSPLLYGPVPQATTRIAVQNPEKYHYFEFPNVPPGNYIIREGGCNPFGCWLDTPVSVIDGDVQVVVNQIGPTPRRAPTVTPTALPSCLGDGNDDRTVTIDELVGAVANSLNGCPP